MTDLPPDSNRADPNRADPRLDSDTIAPGRDDIQTRDLRAALSTGDERARKDTRNIPPLAWIIIVIIIVVGVVMWLNSGGSMKTPTGGSTPVAADAPVASVTPPAAMTETVPDARAAAIPASDALPEPAASQ